MLTTNQCISASFYVLYQYGYSTTYYYVHSLFRIPLLLLGERAFVRVFASRCVDDLQKWLANAVSPRGAFARGGGDKGKASFVRSSQRLLHMNGTTTYSRILHTVRTYNTQSCKPLLASLACLSKLGGILLKVSWEFY